MSAQSSATPKRKPGSLRLNDDEQRSINYRRVVFRLALYLMRYRRRVGLAGVTLLGYSATVVAMPWVVKVAIDDYIAADSGDISGLAVMVALFVVIAVVQFVTGLVHRRMLVTVGQEMLYAMRVELFGQLQRLPMAFFDQNQAGKVMSRIQNDVEHLQELNVIFILSLANALSAVGIVVVMMAMDALLALLTLALVLVLIPALIVFQKLARAPYQRARQTLAEVNSRMQESISGIRVIQSLNREEMNISRFDGANRANLSAGLVEARYWPGLFLSVEVLTGVAMVMLVSVGGNMVIQGTLQVGVVVAFALYVERLFDPIQQITSQFDQLQRAMVAADRMFELLDTDPEASNAPSTAELPPPRGEVRYEGIYFHYDPDTPILQGVDLHVPGGHTVALVGPTGAGKTTLISLLLRYYEPVGGRITLDGVDIRDLDQESLSSRVSVVLQEPHLFSGTVMENIRYNAIGTTDADVERSAEAAGAQHFISRLENGYETMVEEGGNNLSVGQRQLISFARALVADPQVLILDEATASIDTYTEVLIQEVLKELLVGRTALVIAHRLSTVRNADSIAVVDGGRIVERGTHEELLAAGGHYASMQSYA